METGENSAKIEVQTEKLCKRGKTGLVGPPRAGLPLRLAVPRSHAPGLGRARRLHVWATWFLSSLNFFFLFPLPLWLPKFFPFHFLSRIRLRRPLTLLKVGRSAQDDDEVIDSYLLPIWESSRKEKLTKPLSKVYFPSMDTWNTSWTITRELVTKLIYIAVAYMLYDFKWAYKRGAKFHRNNFEKHVISPSQIWDPFFWCWRSSFICSTQSKFLLRSSTRHRSSFIPTQALITVDSPPLAKTLGIRHLLP